MDRLKLVLKTKTINLSNKTLIMAILNVTPDSFFDGGKFNSYDKGIAQIESIIAQKADIIDIGGESTRPGADKVNAKQELERILPFIKYIKKKYKILVSVDTYKSAVAEAVLNEGADIINDISGLQFDKKLGKVIAKHQAGVVLMHIKGTPKTMQAVNPNYKDLMAEIKAYLQLGIKIALENGIAYDNIILDPGIGFGKTVEQNYIILNKLPELQVFKRPILIGLSRKSLIGKVLNNQPASERLIGTVVLNTVSILNGAQIIRVHDVKEHKEVVKVLDYLRKNVN